MVVVVFGCMGLGSARWWSVAKMLRCCVGCRLSDGALLVFL
jgi:hypothetical protein